MTTKPRPAWLILESGEIFEGVSFGAAAEAFGEVVFNTGMTGYVEILTDPSYHGQIVVMTNPHMGNYGVQPEDFESSGPAAAALVVQDHTPHPHHKGSRASLSATLAEYGVPGICGLPTRELTLRVRRGGALRGLVTTKKESRAAWLRKIRKSPKMRGRALAEEVSAKKPFLYKKEQWEGSHRLALLDFGVKRSLLQELNKSGCAVKIFPAASPVEEILGEDPDAIVLSNGPGDPAAHKLQIQNVRQLIASGKPLLGICLGFQLLALAAGGKSYKLRFGHHGSNHPVKDKASGRILITTQNHGFAIQARSLPKDYCSTHVSLNDDTLEGFRHKKRPIRAFQFHPEASPGPLETRALIRDFLTEL